MSSVAVQVMPSVTNFSKDSLIANKLASDLDAKLVSSSKKVLLQRIEFKPASKPDEQYENLRRKYVPVNSPSTKHSNGHCKEQLRSPDKNSNEELPSPKFILFPVENVELDWKQVRRVGPGLSNMGNTCFLNSVLQVLTYTAPLVNYLASKVHSEKCRSVGFCMLCELQKHIVRSFSHHQGEAIKPLAIIQKLKFIAKHLRFGHQEDAHEFLRYVIDGMQRSCLAADGDTETLDRMSKQTTMVHQVFGGYYRSQVRCLKCKNNSNTFDPLMDIMLDIKHVPSVEKALQRSVKQELLDGENLYMCPRCKRKVPAHKQFLIHRAPNILTLQLKRFDYHQSFGGKISKHIEYTEYLNLRPYMTSQGPPIRYRLYAVLVHSGYSANSGHYYCYVRASNGIWYQMNDSMVRQVALKAVLSQQAYLLFYIKQNPKQELKSPLTSPKTVPMPRTPVTPRDNLPKVIRSNDVGTPVKSGIIFHRQSSSTSTVTKPSTTPTSNHAPSAPLAPPSQRPKFAFTISPGNKGNKTEPIAAKREEKDKDEKMGMKEKLKSPSSESVSSEIKSPISSLGKISETFSNPDTSKTLSKSDSSPVEGKEQASGGQKDKNKETSDEGLTLRKENKGKKLSPKKPRPPPLFIPRPVIQGKGTSSNTPKSTTLWTVTPKTTSEPLFGPMSPPPPGVAPPQPSPSSAMSDTSSTSSMMGKTGEWTVSDKTALTPGPRLPERQHAGWQVSKKFESEKEESRILQTEENSNMIEEESDKKKKKKKHKKEKKKKKERGKKEKAKIKYEKLSESLDDDELDKKEKKKRKQKHGAEKDVNEVSQQSKPVEKSKSKKHKMKCRDSNVSPSKKRLVSYADSSSSSESERGTSGQLPGKSTNVDSRRATVESRVPVIHEDEPKKRNAARRATWDGSRDSSVVAQLLTSSKGLHGYGSSVTSWDGGENTLDRSGGKPDRKRQRRDSWNEDYDRGKVKKVKNSKDTSERRFNGNPFQREHDKRKSKQESKERFSKPFSKHRHSRQNHFSKSHSSRKYQRKST